MTKYLMGNESDDCDVKDDTCKITTAMLTKSLYIVECNHGNYTIRINSMKVGESSIYMWKGRCW